MYDVTMIAKHVHGWGFEEVNESAVGRGIVLDTSGLLGDGPF